MNDHRCSFFHVWWTLKRNSVRNHSGASRSNSSGSTPTALDAYGLSLRSCDTPQAACRANNFLQDREAQRRGHFTGLPSFTQEDAAVSMSAGPIRDRSKETLSVADVALPKLYRALLTCARQASTHQDPLGLGADTEHIVGLSGAVTPGAHWRTLVPRHKVVAARRPPNGA